MNDRLLDQAPASGRAGSVIAGRSDLAPLVQKGVVLTVLTLGIYRFWYRTNLRRWYRTNTIVDGDALAFHGTAKELFIGFLIAVAIFTPLYGLFLLAGTLADEQLAQVVSTLYGLVFFALAQFGLYRARRYRLTRTSWRGVHFDQDGSSWHYVRISIGYMLLSVLTLGILFPLLRLRTEAFRIRHTRFGTATGSFDAPLRPLFKKWLLTYFGSLFVLGATGLLSVGLAWAIGSRSTDLLHLTGPVGVLLLAIFVLLFLALLWAAYRGFEFRHFANHTRIGDVQFRSEFPLGAYSKRVLQFWLAVVAMVGCAGAVVIGLLVSAARTGGGFGTLLFVSTIYLGGFILFSIFKELFLDRRFWELACETMTLQNINSVDQIIATALSSENATGEGLADALDFGGV